jgi:hypothetical protein
MQFVVQNRSGASVAGLTLSITTTGATAPTRILPVPSLAAGESYLAAVPVDSAALQANGSLTYATLLTTPPGLTDAAPANNRRTSTLAAPK